jgi:hypothetical protein
MCLPLLLPLPLQVTAPDGRRLTTCKGAPQVVRDLLKDAAAMQAVDRCCELPLQPPLYQLLRERPSASATDPYGCSCSSHARLAHTSIYSRL